MDFRLLWRTNLNKQGEKDSVKSVCFKPDCSQLIAACVNDLFFISPATGEIIEQKRAHHAPICSVRCSSDGNFFASSSSDGKVVVWRSMCNEGYISFGTGAGCPRIEWCPGKQLLLAATRSEYRLWRPEDTIAVPLTAPSSIESVAFSPNGDVYVLSLENGQVQVISTEEPHEVLQTFTYSSIVTTLSFCTIDNVDYLVTSDLECRVSMYRMRDKQLVGKNSLPFEAMCSSIVGGISFFFVFAGISGRVSLLTNTLSYLGDFKTQSNWIWDVCVDNQGRIAIATKEGFVEIRNIEFGIAFADAGDTVAYRNSVNSMSVKNVITSESEELRFNKIIMAISMSSNFLLVKFKDGIIVYKHKQDDDTQNSKLHIEKINEIPGMFENAMFAITRIHIICAEENTLKFFDLTGQNLCQFQFSSKITCVRAASAYNDGAILGCSDGRVFFVTLDMKEPVLISRANKSIVDARRSGLISATLDEDGTCTIYDSFERKLLDKFEGVKSISFSDRVENLLATSTGTELTIHYKNCDPITQFIEGDILGFVRNKIILSNQGAIEITDTALPLKQLIEENKWDLVKKLCAVGPNAEQLSYLATESVHQKKFDVARLVAPSVSKSLSFFVNEVLVNTPRQDLDSTISQFLGNEQYKNIDANNEVSDDEGESNAKKVRAIELEKSGAAEEALAAYADAGEWDDVFRLASEKHLERIIVDYQFSEDQTERAAKVMLSAGLGEGAIRLLTKTHNYASLAKARIYLGQWEEAISLSRLYSFVYNIVYPRFGELLFESGKYFESLVCFFIPKESDERASALQKMIACAAESHAYDQLAFIYLMLGFNQPEMFWRMQDRTISFMAVNQLKNKTLIAMSNEDVKSIFYMSYYVIAANSEFPLIGVNIPEILLQFLISSVALHMKRWVSYALKEISSYKLDDKMRQIAQRAAHLFNETKEENSQISFNCPRCHHNIYASSKVPLLTCGSCGMRIAFSGHSCRPLPLVAFSYNGEDGPELIAHESGFAVPEEIPSDVVTDKFLREQPAEMFVIQKLKKSSGVKPELWYNPELCNVHVCSTCGIMLNDRDFEATAMETEQCAFCHTTLIEGATNEDQQNNIIEMLRPFQEESPVTF